MFVETYCAYVWSREKKQMLNLKEKVNHISPVNFWLINILKRLIFKHKYDKCWHCENFYGPCFGEPLCITCHYFVHPFDAFEEINTATATSGSSRSNSIQNVHLSDEDDPTLVKVKLECSQLINTLESDNLVAGAFNHLSTTSSKIYNGHKSNKLASQVKIFLANNINVTTEATFYF